MTTARTGTRTAAVAHGVRGAALSALAVGTVFVVLAAVLADEPAVLGALIGAGIVIGTFSFGALTVNAVAGRMPAAALLVAMLTYTLQVVLLALVFVALKDSGATEGDIDPQWLGATAIADTLAWVIGQIVGTVRARQPVYDLGRPSGSSGADRGGDLEA